MTLQLTAAGQLQQLQLGLPEIASALVIGKYIGSIFTQQNDANIFSILEKDFEVRVLSVPSWLEDVKFPRTTRLHGQNMRLLKGPMAFENVRIRSLEGLATFVVLCCRYTESVKTMVQILTELILGKVTPLVHPGQFQDSVALPHMVRPLVSTFVRATIDSDADSAPSLRAKEWMAMLGIEIGMAFGRPRPSKLARQKSIDIIGELLGGSCWSRVSSSKQEQDIGETRMFDTMYLGAATIALAASANGADVRLECLSRESKRDLPRPFTCQFVARLWLCQPPPHVTSLLRGSVETKPKDVQDPRYARIDEETSESNIIFGGELEIALNIAQGIGYEQKARQADRLMRLWGAGLQEGLALRWATKPFETNQGDQQSTPYLYFRIHDMRSPMPVKSQVAQLALRIKAWDKRLEPIARRIAQIIDDEYLYADYNECHDEEDIRKATQFIIQAITIGSIHTLVDKTEGSHPRYALNLDAIFPAEHRHPNSVYGRDPKGELVNFLARAMNEGCPHKDIIWAAALLWGGASSESQGNSSVTDRVLGVVAPQCTVVLELIREPLRFAQQGFQGSFLSIHRGSVPVLPRDPNTGYVHGSHLAARIRPVGLDCKAKDTCPPKKSPNELIITFEPDILSTSMASQFCGWYGGELVFELDPIEVMNNILMRRDNRGESTSLHEHNVEAKLFETVRYLDFTELMKLGRYYAENGIVVFETHSDPAWLIAGAGCVTRGCALVQTGPLDLRRSVLDEKRVEHTILHFTVTHVDHAQPSLA